MDDSATSHDVMVIGAGMVGVSSAIALQRAGRRVTLVDRRGPGEETSFGNAGVIEGGTYVPAAVPLSPRELLRYAGNREAALHFRWGFLPRVAPWIWRLAVNSTRRRLRDNGMAVMSLTTHAIGAHKALMAEAGADGLLRENGWLRVYRGAAEFEADRMERDMAQDAGERFDVLEPDDVRDLEPHLQPVYHRAVHWHSVASVSDPGAVTKAYARLFASRGGSIAAAHVLRIAPDGEGWRVETGEEVLRARDLVVAAGPWSMDLLRPLGYRFPFAVKRGYHLHYAPRGNATLARPVVDGAHGYVITPMAAGIRLTTGIEFADRDDPPTPVQIARAERHARKLFPLDTARDEAPWMGRRPCLPDTRPIVGPAPSHRGLWLNFGHAHLGFTLGPVSGRLLAEMIAGAPTVADPAPFAASRF